MMDSMERMTVMLTLIRELEAVLDRETRALKSMTIEAVDELQQEKALLTEAYEIEMDKLRRDPSILGGLDEHVRETFAEEVRSLQATAARNSRALEAARHVIERLVEKLGSSLAPRHGARSYSGAGAQPNPTGEVIAVAFNHAV